MASGSSWRRLCGAGYCRQLKAEEAGLLGVAQGVLGILGTASGGVSQAIGTGTPGNIFNIPSGAAFGALGLGVGLPIVSGLNGLVGILGAVGVNNIAGVRKKK